MARELEGIGGELPTVETKDEEGLIVSLETPTMLAMGFELRILTCCNCGWLITPTILGVEEGGQVVNLAREGLHLPDRLMMKAIIILILPHIERIPANSNAL